MIYYRHKGEFFQMTDREVGYEETKPLRAGVVAGAIGMVLVFVIHLALYTGGIGQEPVALRFTEQWMGLHGANAIGIGLLLFLIAGAGWGAAYAAWVNKTSIGTGAAFGLVPWLANMFVLKPFVSQPLLAGGDPLGIFVPLILLVFWGAFVGALVPALPFPRQVWWNDRG